VVCGSHSASVGEVYWGKKSRLGYLFVRNIGLGTDEVKIVSYI